jgi:hypothetical protein
MHLEPQAVKILLGERMAEGVSDSRALAASVVFHMPEGMGDTPVHEFLGWMQGTSPALVEEYERATMVGGNVTLGDLEPFQRAALIGALRLRREIE